MAGAHDGLTIFMYPWFAMGHITPYLLTANKLAERGHKVIMIVPPKAHSVLLPLNLHPSLIHFRSIPLPRIDGLPPHVETTNDVSIQQHGLLLCALDLTQPTVESLLRELKPDFVFFDHMHWLPGLARRLQIKSVHYSVVSSAAMGLLFADASSIEGLRYPPGYPPSIKLYTHAVRDFKWFESSKEMGGGITLKERWMTAICESDALGFRTCKETEGVFCEFLENRLHKPILLAGPTVPKPQALTLEEKWAHWLKKFKPKTVVFCAFGSEAVLGRDQFEELLLGFELTGLPFLIGLRPPSGVDTIEEALPDGFKARTAERGIVHGEWVPQHLILEHPSVGCFVTHCGYGSTWEGLMSECQLVALPHAGDQHVQARLLSDELRVAVEVEKGDEDGLFTKEGVRRAIMAAMGDQSGIGKEVRANHHKWKEILLSKGLQDSYMDALVDELRGLLQ